ncbi:MAG: hypothetical protein VX313_05635, partial [Bacteroidota bacterium]|nr:hypothetical protein [Bacteroidota bacterium]
VFRQQYKEACIEDSLGKVANLVEQKRGVKINLSIHKSANRVCPVAKSEGIIRICSKPCFDFGCDVVFNEWKREKGWNEAVDKTNFVIDRYEEVRESEEILSHETANCLHALRASIEKNITEELRILKNNPTIITEAVIENKGERVAYVTAVLDTIRFLNEKHKEQVREYQSLIKSQQRAEKTLDSLFKHCSIVENEADAERRR